MDIENLSYDYIKRFFDMYFDEGDLNDYYFCKECRKMQEMESLDQNCFEHNQIQTTEDIKFLNSIIFIERDYICNNEFCEKDILFNKAQCNEKNLEDLSDNEIINIMKKYTNINDCDLDYFYCKICKFVRVINYYHELEITKNGIKYSSECTNCNKIYPECCIDYYKFPLSGNDDDGFLSSVDEDDHDLCIDCFNETNAVNLKPAK
jgi:hypothetical protein